MVPQKSRAPALRRALRAAPLFFSFFCVALFACGSSSSEDQPAPGAPRASPTCSAVPTCPGYQRCCSSAGDCHYVDPTGYVENALPASCTGAPDAAPIDTTPWVPNDFVGTWTVVSASGQSQCGNGPIQAQPVPTALDIVTQTGPDTLAWFERGGCQGVPLRFKDNVATLDTPSFDCNVTVNGRAYDLRLSTIVLTLPVASSDPPDGGAVGDAGDAGDALAPPAPPSQMGLDLADTTSVNGTSCWFTVHYGLERVP